MTLGACAVAALTVLSCKKDNDPPSGGSGGGGTTPPATASVRFTINGDGFSGQVVDLSPPTGTGEARYSPEDDETAGTSAINATNMFFMTFEGNTTGTQLCNGGTGEMGFSFQVNGQQYLNYTDTMTITEYGAVGGWVRGTFGGTVIRVNGASAGTQATITNGTFNLKRMSDV